MRSLKWQADTLLWTFASTWPLVTLTYFSGYARLKDIDRHVFQLSLWVDQLIALLVLPWYLHCEFYFLGFFPSFVFLHSLSFFFFFGWFSFFCVPILSAVFLPVTIPCSLFPGSFSFMETALCFMCCFLPYFASLPYFCPLLASFSYHHTLPNLAHKCSASVSQLNFAEKNNSEKRKKTQPFPMMRKSTSKDF